MGRRTITVSILVLVLGIGGFMLWLNSLTQMKPVQSYEVYADSQGPRLLIATQGSHYKDALVSAVIDELSEQKPYIKVIDVAELGSIDRQDWNGILLIQAWEKWEPHPAVAAFIGNDFDPEKMFLVTTSDSGDSQMEGIDGITGESSIPRVEQDVARILAWADGALDIEGVAVNR